MFMAFFCAYIIRLYTSTNYSELKVKFMQIAERAYFSYFIYIGREEKRNDASSIQKVGTFGKSPFTYPLGMLA